MWKKIKNLFKPKHKYELTYRGKCMMDYCQNIINDVGQSRIAAYEESLYDIIQSNKELHLDRKLAAQLLIYTIETALKN